MALDNPSYFSMSSGTTSTLPSPSRSKFPFFRRTDSSAMGTSASSPSTSYAFDDCHPATFCGHSPALPTPPIGVQLPQSRRNIRTLLRSVSANSTESNQELLIMGEPRPSDIAPPSPFPDRCHPFASDTSDDCSPRRTKSLRRTPKCSAEFLPDLVYCPLPTSDTEDDKLSEIIDAEEEEEEVFLAENSVRYYNLAAPRRHSIGTYYNRDRKGSMVSTSRSLKESVEAEFPQPLVHFTADGETVRPVMTPVSVGESSRSGSVAGSSGIMQPTGKCQRCAPNKGLKSCKMSVASGNGAAMDDILILFSQTASLWADYVNTCFDRVTQQRGRPYKIILMTIEELTSGIGVAREEHLAAVKVQIVILCPTFLNFIAELATEPAQAATGCSVLARIIQPGRVLAMLLGVNEANITRHHKTALTSYHQWRRFLIKDQDHKQVGEFLEEAITIMNKVAKQQSIIAQQEKSQFSIVPKKVKVGQRRVIALLNEPLQRDDNVKISVDKSVEMIEVTSFKRRNPYTLQFSIPESCLEVSRMVNVVVEKNGSVLGSQPVKCESRLRELDQILRSNDNPMEFMCQTLGFDTANHEHLDNFMVQSFQRNLPPHFNLLMPPSHNHLTPQHKNPEEYPTLLHFAARFGLEKLAWQLLECPGGEQACEIRNFCELTPAEIAENAGYLRLAQTLKGYMQMNEFSNMYHMLKGLSDKRDTGDTADEYLLPRPLGETYMVPPSARPFTPPSQSFPDTGYMEMNSNKKHTSSINRSNSPTICSASSQTSLSSPGTTPTDRFGDIKQLDYQNEQKSIKLRQHNSLERPTLKRDISMEDHVQTELADIINDFKNKVISIQEVEKLVENWRNRNDVQQSFKDKQDALIKMREEYDRIQKLMKDDSKKNTPFDRFKKFFSRGKSKHNVDDGLKNRVNSVNTILQDKRNGADNISLCQSHRPISSLSCQSTSSSSSSARMSTASASSAGSFGDSGTHSDIEDRKAPGYNYLVPPPPKSVYKYGTPPGRFSPQTGWKFQERPSGPIEQSSYYIQFPPSGLPVNSTFDNKLSQIIETDVQLSNEHLNNGNHQEYLDFASVEMTPKEKPYNHPYHDDNEDCDAEEKLLPEYMNCKPVSVTKSNLPPLKPKIIK